MNDDERSNEFRACCLRTPFPLPPPFYSNNQYNRDGTSQRVSGEKESNLLPRDTTGLTTRYKKKKKKKRKSRLGQLSSNLSLTQNRQSLADQSVSKPFSLSLLSPASAFKSGLLSPSLAFHSLAGR